DSPHEQQLEEVDLLNFISEEEVKYVDILGLQAKEEELPSEKRASTSCSSPQIIPSNAV
ncbi:hypothetical protein KI387_016422, partial [Taxus chinensis]